MKRLRACLTIVLSRGIGSTYAYTPTSGDVQTLSSLIEQIETIIEDDNPIQYSFTRQIDNLRQEYTDPESRIHYLLEGLYTHFHEDLLSQKSQADEITYTSYETFLRRHEDQLVDSQPLPPSCFEHIDDLAMLAFVHNTSLPVLIATWYREYTCGYSLPSNGRGPMQIISKDYGEGPFDSHDQFISIMEDYILFSENKHARYNRVTDSGQPITLSYTDISYADIIKHGALYNGLAGGTIYGDIAPAAPSYVFDKFGTTHETASREGLMAASTKVMQRLVENH